MNRIIVHRTMADTEGSGTGWTEILSIFKAGFWLLEASRILMLLVVDGPAANNDPEKNTDAPPYAVSDPAYVFALSSNVALSWYHVEGFRTISAPIVPPDTMKECTAAIEPPIRKSRFGWLASEPIVNLQGASKLTDPRQKSKESEN